MGEGEVFFLFLFQCTVSCELSIPETIRSSANSLYIQVSLCIEHHVRSLNVSFLLTFIVWLIASIATPLQLVTILCIDNTMSELSVKDFLIA